MAGLRFLMPQGTTIPALDGYPLGATLFVPARSPRAVVLLAPATGVPRRLYDAFGAFLQSEGFAVVTWDWRGIGDSGPASLRGFAATMRGWGERDLGGAIQWAAERYDGLPLVAVGHSFGGQALGLAPNAEQLDAIVLVTAQEGYWRLWPSPRRYLYGALWYAGVPLAVAALGYFPSRRLGLGEDLPAGVAREWARWCRDPAYLGTWDGHARLAVPLLSYCFTDDPLAPVRASDALLSRYRA
ncbi:MAG: alpha/beta fold hydrolase, partial [Gemmatimonadota bacterium]